MVWAFFNNCMDRIKTGFADIQILHLNLFKACLVKRLSFVKKNLCLLDQDLLHMRFSFPCPNIHSQSCNIFAYTTDLKSEYHEIIVSNHL